MDPYNDEDSSQEGNDMNMLGGGEPSPTFMRGLNVLGSSIRDGGFCSPKAKKKAADADTDTLTAPSTEETTRTPKRVSESEDSDNVKIRSVTFVDDVEPLIVQDDLVIEEDKSEKPEPDVNEKAAEVVVEEQTKTEIDEKKEQTESAVAVAVASRKSIIPTNVIALLSAVSLAIAYFYPGSLSPIIENIHLANEKMPMGTGTAIVFAVTVSAVISSSAQIALATELIWAALVSMMVSAGAYHVIFS